MIIIIVCMWIFLLLFFSLPKMVHKVECNNENSIKLLYT